MATKAFRWSSWWDEWLPPLRMDVAERLGTPIGAMRACDLFAFFLSLKNIEGSHVNTKMRVLAEAEKAHNKAMSTATMKFLGGD